MICSILYSYRLKDPKFENIQKYIRHSNIKKYELALLRSGYLKTFGRLYLMQYMICCTLHRTVCSEPRPTLHLPKRPCKCSKVDFLRSVSRKLVRVRYHFKWLFQMILQSELVRFDIYWGRNSKNPGIQPNYSPRN